jgi:eukaryotic-like serine/threonine-protein kinase
VFIRIEDEYTFQGPCLIVWRKSSDLKDGFALELRERELHPESAIQFLAPVEQYDLGAMVPGFALTSAYIRGLAYIQAKKPSEAQAQFQKILDHKGLADGHIIYPLSHLGIARAAVLANDTAKARTAYQDFLALWKDADPDVPILNQAKAEYEKLK